MTQDKTYVRLSNADREYYVADDGNIYNSSLKKLRPQVSEAGFLYVIIRPSNGEYKKVYIGNAVARNFVDNPHQYKYIQYLDGDKANTHPSNLVWVRRPVTANYRAPNKGRAIHCITTGQTFKSAYQAAKHLGVSCTRIYQVIGTSRTVHGLHFKYVAESL